MKVKWNEMKMKWMWNVSEIKWNEMKMNMQWNKTKWNDIKRKWKWNENEYAMKLNEIKIKMKWNEMKVKWNEMKMKWMWNVSEIKWNEMKMNMQWNKTNLTFCLSIFHQRHVGAGEEQAVARRHGGNHRAARDVSRRHLAVLPAPHGVAGEGERRQRWCDRMACLWSLHEGAHCGASWTNYC